MSEDYKNCPFCGKSNVLLDEPYNEDEYGIVCNSCGAIGGCNRDGELAVNLWNTRPIENELKARVAELEARLAVAEKFLMSAANYGLGIQQARKYFGQDNPNYIHRQDPPGYDELEVCERRK